MDQITRMRCFLKVADHKGFSAAAREMGRSKALVSKYIGELEDELGVRLLNRTTRQVSLTEVGQAYYKEASEILQRLDELQVSVQSSQQAVRGRLRISAPRSMGDHLFNQAVMEFLAANPDVTVDLRLEDRFVDLVEEGFDLAIRVAALCDLGFVRTPLIFVADEIAAGKLVVLLEESEQPMRGIHAVYPHRRHLTGKVRAFVDFLVEWFGAHSYDPCRGR